MTKNNRFRKLAINMIALSFVLPCAFNSAQAAETSTTKTNSTQTLQNLTTNSVQSKTLSVTETNNSIVPMKDKANQAIEGAKNKLDQVQKMLNNPLGTATAPSTTTTSTTTAPSTTTASTTTTTITTETKGATVVKPEEKKETIVLMDTDKGPIKIKLFMEESPITAGNFKDLVERGFYNGLTFHRLIKGFVIQGGCPLGNGMGGFTDPTTGKQRTIKHEKNNLKHDKAGMLAMARTNDPDSASSQFFIDLAPLPALNAGGVDPYGYVVFGQVVEGMDVVNKIMNENVAPHPGSDGTSNPVHIKTAKVI